MCKQCIRGPRLSCIGPGNEASVKHVCVRGSPCNLDILRTERSVLISEMS